MNKPLAAVSALLLMATLAHAKLPAPSDEAKAKAAEASAKAAHTGKIDGFKLCNSMNRVAATYFAQAKTAGKTVKAATETPACADPGTFVYPPPAAAAAPATAVAAVKGATPAAAPAAPPAAPAKK